MKLTACGTQWVPFLRHLLGAVLMLTSAPVFAQPSLYTYQDLSQTAYARQRDSLKAAWVCPSLYAEKATQKKYKELWDARVEFITSAINNQHYLAEKEIHTYLNGILEQLLNGNSKQLPVKPFLLIDRSSAVNAYATGGNVIAVNLGLLHFVQSREELALVMAHELAHTILKHPENAMKEKAEWLTSEDYAASLKEVQAAKYERLTRLKKVVENYSLTNSRHHRYHESDADSLAIVLLKNSNIGFDARFFLRLDSADTQYEQPLQKPIATYFTAYGLGFEQAWTRKRTRGLSARTYNFTDSTKLNDSLKTHPDCAIRYAQTLQHSTAGLQLTPVPASLQQKAAKIIIWNLFNKLSLTASLYRILQEKDRGNGDPWYDFMLANVISGLHHADKSLRRFNAIGIVPKEQVCKSYDELQTALEQIPRDNLAQFHLALQKQPFQEKLSSDAKALQQLMDAVIASTDSDDGTLKKSAQRFIDTHKESMYCEFAQHFTGK